MPVEWIDLLFYNEVKIIQVLLIHIAVFYLGQGHIHDDKYSKKVGPDKIEEDGESTIPQLAHKSKNYIDSDPREFYKWFNDKANDQLKRIVRYLKAWRDKQNKSYSTKLPSGLVLTILATNNYVEDERDDIAFRDTLEAIKSKIDDNYECKRPTTKKDEDLLEKYSESHFKDRLNKFIDSGNKAIDLSNPKEGCKKWQKHFGDRFVCANIEDKSNNSAKSYSEPAVFNVNAGSA